MRRVDLVPLALALAFVVLFAIRGAFTHSLTYLFLFWNLALAAVPWLIAHAARLSEARQQHARAWALLVPWLLFLPNAPYVITDFVHLRARAPVPLWLDAMLLGCASLAGLAFAVSSLRHVHQLVRARMGELAGWTVITLSCAASGIGIWLGRVQRHNSWDLLVHPRLVLRDAAELAMPIHWRALVASLVLALVLGAAYIATLRPARPRLAFAPPLLCMAAIWALSSVSLGPMAIAQLPLYDKIAHFAVYGLLALLVSRAASGFVRPRTAMIVAAAIVLAWGSFDELHQAFVPGRNADILDFTADMLGAAFGLTLRFFLERSDERSSVELAPEK